MSLANVTVEDWDPENSELRVTVTFNQASEIELGPGYKLSFVAWLEVGFWDAEEEVFDDDLEDGTAFEYGGIEDGEFSKVNQIYTLE
jgi:hypothetical protein